MKSEKKYQFKKFDQQTRANLPNLQPLKSKKNSIHNQFNVEG
jgi:hypothetical protein